MTNQPRNIVSALTLKTIDLRSDSKNPEGYERFRENVPLSSFKSKPAKDGRNRGILTGYRNDITVVDLDFYTKDDNIYDPDKCIFVKKFGKDYIDVFDTYTVLSPHGGHHLYFNYDPDVKQCQGSPERIDIRNDGGYIVAPFSQFEGKIYEPIRDTEIKDMPDNLREWLLTMIVKPIVPNARAIQKQFVKHDEIDEDDIDTYSYNISYDEFVNIVSTLPPTYWTEFKKWHAFTTSAKILGYRDAWDDNNKHKPRYDIDNNNKIWDSIDVSMHYAIDRILIDSGNKHFINYCKYKPVPNNVIKPARTINREKLGYDFFRADRNYIVKSDTGTGKTTSFCNFIKKDKRPFISIVSRVSLGETHYDAMAGARDKLKYYEAQNDFEKGDSVIIQIDSLKHLTKIDDFANYVIFLDEFNSIVEHLVTSPTLSKSRVLIDAYLHTIISSCSQFICVDADISDNCINFMDDITKKFEYVENEHRHNKDTPATEIFDYEIFIEKLKNEDAYICACDSALEAQRLFDILKVFDDTIVLYTSETRETDKYDGKISLDRDKKIIFSPRVMYGLDSIISRPVYCLYKEHTISPLGMLQQVNRDRKITHLYFLFTQKTFIRVRKTLADVTAYIDKTDRYGQMTYKMSCNDLLKSTYLRTLAAFEYRNECYMSNKYVHFLKLLDIRGFKRTTSALRTTFIKISKEEIEKRDDDKIEKFNIENKFNARINSILKIPKASADKYVEYFINPSKLSDHFKFCDVFIRDLRDIIRSIENNGDFGVNKTRSEKAKILFVKHLRKSCGITDQYGMTIKNIPKNDVCERLYSEYKILFKSRNKAVNFNDKESMQSSLNHAIKQLLNINIASKKKQCKGIRDRIYSIDPDIIVIHETLYKFRNPDRVTINLFTGRKLKCEYIQYSAI